MCVFGFNINFEGKAIINCNCSILDSAICTNCTILGGVTIGDNSVIGAGSVVSKDIPSDVIAIGSPCKVLRKITDKDRMII